MGNPFGDQVKSARLRAESLSAEGRWAEAAEAFEDLANAWIASCATVSPAARKDRLDEVAAARKMAAKCRSKVAQEPMRSSEHPDDAENGNDGGEGKEEACSVFVLL